MALPSLKDSEVMDGYGDGWLAVRWINHLPTCSNKIVVRISCGVTPARNPPSAWNIVNGQSM